MILVDSMTFQCATGAAQKKGRGGQTEADRKLTVLSCGMPCNTGWDWPTVCQLSWQHSAVHLLPAELSENFVLKCNKSFTALSLT